jgi:mannose-1-phosphate guanylyltransferase
VIVYGAINSHFIRDENVIQMETPTMQHAEEQFTVATQPAPIIPVILCGGAGSRLWPVSREQHPKPFIKLDDSMSLLQKTLERAISIDGVNQIITVTNRELFFRTEDEYKDLLDKHTNTIVSSYILEPFGRNTAPAIISAALHAKDIYGKDSILLVLPADHLISDLAAFAEAIEQARQLSQQRKLVLFGINPTSPETGYGYIEHTGNQVDRFVEKPCLEKATAYLEAGNFLWNSGMFCFTAEALLREAETHSPELYRATANCMLNSKHASGQGFYQVQLSADDFEQVPNDSIDYSVMEKTHSAAVIKCDFSWSDVGCWKTLGDLSTPDADNNRIEGNALVQNSRNCTIKSDDRVVGVVGVENLIIVDTADALLVANKQRSQDVKHIYTKLKDLDHESHKCHRTVHRPWGAYTVLETGRFFKIKRIEVKPGRSISLQLHHHRSEHWVVVQGTAKVLNNTVEFVISENQSTYIPATHKHRLENIGSEPLVIIEVQTGHYLGEDDIVRFKDIYGRETSPVAALNSSIQTGCTPAPHPDKRAARLSRE